MQKCSEARGPGMIRGCARSQKFGWDDAGCGRHFGDPIGDFVTRCPRNNAQGTMTSL
jgi:hypothetical protein